MRVEKKLLVALSRISCVGPRTYRLFAEHFPSLADVWSANLTTILQAGIPQKTAEEFIRQKTHIDPDHEYTRMLEAGADVLSPDDPSYPERLTELYDPPFALFYRGILPAHDTLLFAVIGTRKLTAYGLHITQPLVEEVARHGIVIVSGLALGIDALSHMAALSAGGTTIAVLGSGVDRQSMYPRANAYLAEQIVDQGGCLLSEYPVGTSPQKHHFPARNRIVACLSKSVLVIEAPEKSGALVTARLALEYGRDVCAVPGAITNPASKGSNELIKNGAIVITSSQDVLDLLLGPGSVERASVQKSCEPLTNLEVKILNALTVESLHVNDLSKVLFLDIQTLNSTLLVMEMKGFVKNAGHMRYVKAT